MPPKDKPVLLERPQKHPERREIKTITPKELDEITASLEDTVKKGDAYLKTERDELHNRLIAIPPLDPTYAELKEHLANTIQAKEADIGVALAAHNKFESTPDDQRTKDDRNREFTLVHSELIDGLEQIAAMTYEKDYTGKDEQKQLHDKAKQTRENLERNAVITVTYFDDDGNSIPKEHITLAEWDDIVDQKALNLWKKLTNSGGCTEAEYSQDDKVHPLTRYTLRQLAKQELLRVEGNGRINKGVTVDFWETDATKTVSPAKDSSQATPTLAPAGEPAKPAAEATQTKETKESAEKRVAAVAHATITDVVKKYSTDDAGELLDVAEIRKTVEANPVMANLEPLYLAYRHAEGNRRVQEYLAAAMYTELQNLTALGADNQVLKGISPETRQNLADILGEESIEVAMSNTQQNLAKNVLSNLIDHLSPTAKEGRELRAEINKDPDRVFRNAIIALRMQLSGIEPEMVYNNLIKMKGLFTAADVAMIKTLVVERDPDQSIRGRVGKIFRKDGEKSNLESTLEQLGLTVEDVADPREWAKKNATELAKLTLEGDDSLKIIEDNPEQMAKRENTIAARAAVIVQHCNIDTKDINFWHFRLEKDRRATIVGLLEVIVLLLMLSERGMNELGGVKSPGGGGPHE